MTKEAAAEVVKRLQRFQRNPELSAAERAAKQSPTLPAASAPGKDWRYEEQLQVALEARGITGFVREYPWCRGRKFVADLCFVERRILIEVDGNCHRTKARFQRDIERSQLALLQDWKMIRVSGLQVRDGTAAEIVDEILKIIG